MICLFSWLSVQQESCLLALHHKWHLILFLWPCLLFPCFLALEQKISHCICLVVIPQGKLLGHVGVKGPQSLLFFYWDAGLSYFTDLNLNFHGEDTLCLYLFLMSILITVNRFSHTNIGTSVQMMM